LDGIEEKEKVDVGVRMKFRLIVQLPEPQKSPEIIGTLSVDEKEALFFVCERLVAILKKPEFGWINPDGIFIRGFEPVGTTKTNQQKFNYQEWFCVYIKE